MLEHGLGRAVLFLQNEPDTARYRDIIAQACREDWRYDRQIDEGHAPFLYDVTLATREPDYYVAVIGAALETIATPREAEETSRAQVIELAALLTSHGALRDPLYRAIERAATEADHGILTSVSEALIGMDGVTGYRFLAEQWLRFPEKDEEQWNDDYLLDELYDHLGDPAATDALNALAQDAPHLTSYIAAARAARDTHNRESKKAQQEGKAARPRIPTEEDIRAYVNAEARPKPRIHLVEPEIRTRLTEDLRREKDPARRLRWLRFFRSNAHPLPFPGDPRILLDLVRQHEDERAAWYAALALEHTTHPEVRAAALELLQTEGRVEHGACLLHANPSAGDAALLQELVARDFDADAFHHIGISILEYVERHDDPSLLPILFACYEKMACSFCRRGVVRELLKRDALPPGLRAECRYDAHSDTRDLVK